MIQLLGEMTGQHILQMFTTRNFAFLREKKPAMKETLRKLIAENGEECVVEQITAELATVLIPSRPHPNLEKLE